VPQSEPSSAKKCHWTKRLRRGKSEVLGRLRGFVQSGFPIGFAMRKPLSIVVPMSPPAVPEEAAALPVASTLGRPGGRDVPGFSGTAPPEVASSASPPPAISAPAPAQSPEEDAACRRVVAEYLERRRREELRHAENRMNLSPARADSRISPEAAI
jgi:hypothetical protein